MMIVDATNHEDGKEAHIDLARNRKMLMYTQRREIGRERERERAQAALPGLRQEHEHDLDHEHGLEHERAKTLAHT